MNIDADAIVRAIQEAVNAADKKGIAVTVKIQAGAFFPTERDTVTIIATPKGAA